MEKKDKFIKVPKSFIREGASNNSEILIYYCLYYRDNWRSETAVSISEITEMCGYSSKNQHKSSFLHKVRNWLMHYLNEGKLKQINGLPPDKADIKEHLVFKLTDKFYSSNFVMLTDEEFNTIVHFKTRVPKYSLLRCYLYIKSFMFQNTEQLNGMICAYYRDMDDTAEVLNITRKQLDKALELFIKNGLLIKHETGSYKNSIGLITNAPNIYVLTSDDQAEEHINDATKRLKHILKVKKFMPTVYRGKKIKKEVEADE